MDVAGLQRRQLRDSLPYSRDDINCCVPCDRENFGEALGHSVKRLQANERPHRFTLAMKTTNIASIEDRWHEPNAEYFKVRTTGGKLYLLRYDGYSERIGISKATWPVSGGVDLEWHEAGYRKWSIMPIRGKSDTGLPANPSSVATPITVVVNWTASLKK